MRPKRLLLAVLLTAALVPGTWLRTPESTRDFQWLSRTERLEVTPSRSGPFTLVAAWEMSGDRVHFGGFSALVVLDKTRFLAGTDGGRKLVFERPDRSDLPGILSPFDADQTAYKWGRDLESLAIDPASGTVWAGYEFRESIVRFDEDLKPEGEVRPEAMREWGGNSGAEALVRLADGRFLVIEERATAWGGLLHNGVLFARDPLETTEPESVAIRIPSGYRPVDAAPLAGGRALVLLRRVKWALPPIFESAIAEIDIDDRDEEGALEAKMLAEFGDAIPQDNYEGMALTRDEDATYVWLISDDNFMSFQRTLLLKLRWQPREKARE